MSSMESLISGIDPAPPKLAEGDSIRQLAVGLALAAIYGLALGARFGLVSMAVHAAGVPLCFLAVNCLAGPAFYIGLAHAGVVLEPVVLSRAALRGTITAGRVLAGLAPAQLLMGVTCESVTGVALFGSLGLTVGFGLGLKIMLGELGRVESPRPLGARLLSFAFVIFSGVLASRLCWLVLPIAGRL